MLISESAGTQFSSMISDSAIVYVRWRFQRQPLNWVPVMISGSVATQFLSVISDSVAVYVSAATEFSSMISDSAVVYVRWRFQRQT